MLDVFADEIRERLRTERLLALLSGFFGTTSAILSGIGLYGLLSYGVARRRSEMGIRMALGATRGVVIRLVFREALALMAVGTALGALLALGLAQFASSMVFGIQPRDPATLLISVACLAAIALASTLLPARRAASVDPIVALRQE